MTVESNEGMMTDYSSIDDDRAPIPAYVWNRKTSEFVGVIWADPDPMDVENWIKPFSSTFDKPPEIMGKQSVVRDFEKNIWVVKPDYRGAEYWLADGSKHKITELGEELPDDALLEEPPKPEPTFEERLAFAIAQREGAYKAESDPLYMEWQYDRTDEAEQAWRDKVAEIKARFPLPTE